MVETSSRLAYLEALGSNVADSLDGGWVVQASTYTQANHDTSTRAHDGDICAFPQLDPIVPAASLLKLALVNACCCDISCLDSSIQYHFLSSGIALHLLVYLMCIEHAYPGVGNKIDQTR
jgi:hypothetical protein